MGVREQIYCLAVCDLLWNAAPESISNEQLEKLAVFSEHAERVYGKTLEVLHSKPAEKL